MDYEKDYDLPFGKIFVVVLASLRHKVVGFHCSFLERTE